MMKKKSFLGRRGILISCFFVLTFVLSSSLTFAAPANKSWRTEWEKVLKGAKKEGTLVLYAGDMVPAVQNTLTQAMQNKFGVKLEIITGRSQGVIAKLEAERHAGLYLGDIYMSGTGSTQSILKPAGYLAPLGPELILPEVLNGKNWVGGHLLWVDKDHYNLAFLAIPKIPLTYNTQMVKPEEIKSWHSLLDPKWKGKIIFNDPSVTGSGAAVFMALAKGIMNLDYLKQLAKQDLIITRDQRQQAEWLVKGKYPLGIGLEDAIIMNFRKVGAPIGFVIPREGSYITCGTGSIALLAKAPHPNAAKLFINWLLTKEGQTIFTRAHGNPSARVDVPTDFLSPELKRQPGVKYFNTISAKYAAQRRKYTKIAKQIFMTP